MADSIKSTSDSTKHGMIVLNPDGSNISGGSGTSTVQGDVASAGTDSGNPVKIGGVFMTTQPTVTNGQRVDAQFSSRGALRVVAGTETFTVGGNSTNNSAATSSGFQIELVASSAVPSAVGADGRAVHAWGDLRGRTVMTQKCATGTVTSVPDSATNVTVLASNAARLGARIVNTSSALLYIKYAATAATNSFSQTLAQNASLDVPYGYTGIIDGIWASDPGDGAAVVTEFT